MNSPAAWPLRGRGGGFLGHLQQFLILQRMRASLCLRMSYVGLPRRDFEPFRPEFPQNPHRFVRLGERISREKFVDAPLREDYRGVVVRILRVFAVLADAFGLT